ncbi:MAG: MFS transporter [Acidobacteriota bacterium]|nr:MFS transporter [Acidobacteriota bacterium]
MLIEAESAATETGFHPPQRALRALDWLNFWLADIQTGVGPFLAAALTTKGWNPEQIGTFLTLGGLLGIGLQTPAGALVDATRRKRSLIAAGIAAIVAASLTLALGHRLWSVIVAQLLLGSVGPFMGPAVMAITLGLVGQAMFDSRIGRNASFNSAGNVFAALLMGWVGWKFGIMAIFFTVPLLSIPALLSLRRISAKDIDYLRPKCDGSGAEERRVAAPRPGERPCASGLRGFGFSVPFC